MVNLSPVLAGPWCVLCLRCNGSPKAAKVSDIILGSQGAVYCSTLCSQWVVPQCPFKGIFIYILIKKNESTHSQKGSLANSIVKGLMQISKVFLNFFKLDDIYIKINMSLPETQNWSKQLSNWNTRKLSFTNKQASCAVFEVNHIRDLNIFLAYSHD